MSDIKNVLLAGVGAVATTYEKADEMIEQFVKKGRLTVDEGKELTQELKRNFDSKVDKTLNKTADTVDSIRHVSRYDVKQIVEEYNFAYKAEFDNLRNRIDELENRVKELEGKNN